MPTPVSATDTVRNTGAGPSLAVSTRGSTVPGPRCTGDPEPSVDSAAEVAASSAAAEMDACSVILPPAGVNLHAFDRRLKLHWHV